MPGRNLGECKPEVFWKNIYGFKPSASNLTAVPAETISDLIDAYRNARNWFAVQGSKGGGVDATPLIIPENESDSAITSKTFDFGTFCDHSAAILAFLMNCALPNKSGGLDEKNIVLIRIIVQTFGNAVTGDGRGWEKCMVYSALAGLFPEILAWGDAKVKLYTAMVLYNCLCPVVLSDMHSRSPDYLALITGRLLTSLDDENEWAAFALQWLLTQKRFLAKCYAEISRENQHKLLHFICSDFVNCPADAPLRCLDDQKNEHGSEDDEGSLNEESSDENSTSESRQNTIILHPSNLSYISDNFVSISKPILMDNDGGKGDETMTGDSVTSAQGGFGEVDIENMLLVLNSLGEISSERRHMTCWQSGTTATDCNNLLEACLQLLLRLERVANDPSSPFAISRDLLKMTPNHSDTMIGFRADLIRLIGNVVFRNPKGKELIRNCPEALRAILNSTTPDAKNPFITQWAVLAIRNLTEGDFAIQAEIAHMTQTTLGVDPRSLEVLRQFGVTAQLDPDGNISIKPK